MSIYVGVTLTEAEQRHLAEAVRNTSPGAEMRLVHSTDGRDAFARCDLAFGRFPLEWLAGPHALRWVQLDSVGFDDLLPYADAFAAARVVVTNLHGFFADPVAETIVAGLLGLYRGLPQLLAAQGQRRWQKMEVRPQLRLLRGANVLLAGYGSIGRRVEELLRPYECTVRALASGRAAGGDLLDEAGFDEALASADVIISTLPETPRTRAFFDRRRFERMRASAVFANVGRGGVVDESALADALRARRLAGAVIDVTVREPLPESDPLWDCPNVVLTQHTAGGTHDEMARKIDAFADNLRRFRANEPLRGVVDFTRGY